MRKLKEIHGASQTKQSQSKQRINPALPFRAMKKDLIPVRYNRVHLQGQSSSTLLTPEPPTPEPNDDGHLVLNSTLTTSTRPPYVGGKIPTPDPFLDYKARCVGYAYCRTRNWPD